MILEEETFKKFGYYPRDLTLHSHKKVLAKCDGCGKIREINKNNHHPLCHQYYMKDSKRIEKMRKTITGKNASDETKRKMSEAQSGEKHWNYGQHPSEETKNKISKTLQGRSFSKETIEKMKGSRGFHHSEESKEKMKNSRLGKIREKSSNWKGGISFEPYCPLFDEDFKERVREFFDRTCYLCGRTEAEQMDEMRENGKRAFRLAVHHVGYNKDTCCDDSPPLFAPLCIKCHAKTNKKRTYWENYFTEKIMKECNGKCFISKKKNE